MAWQVQLKFKIGGAPPIENLHRKIHLFLFRGCQATDVWKRRFLYSNFTVVSWVSWDTWHIIACLGLNCALVSRSSQIIFIPWIFVHCILPQTALNEIKLLTWYLQLLRNSLHLFCLFLDAYTADLFCCYRWLQNSVWILTLNQTGRNWSSPCSVSARTG